VIIAVIVFGTFLFSPVLARTRTNGQAIQCLNNQRQVMEAWMMYAADHSDQVANNFGINGTQSEVSSQTYQTWANDIMSWDSYQMNTNVLLLRVGQLAPYLNGKSSVFKCPADNFLSPLQRAAAWTARGRSISMNSVFGRFSAGSDSTAQGFNSFLTSYAQYLRLAAVPKPSRTWVVLDEHPDSINDGYFVVDPNSNQWGDIPASYHNGGCGIAFADGHSEIRKWISATSKLPVRFVYFPVPLDPAGKLDLQWCLERTGYIDARTGKPAYGY